MATKKTNGSKRLSPSVERQIALALVRVIECVKTVDALAAERSEKHELYEQAVQERDVAIDEAKRVLADNGYGELESIASRVEALELQLQAAMDLKQYKDIAPLGAALERAKRGLSPLPVTEKKAKAAPSERKPRTAKAVATIIAAFNSGTKFVALNGDAVTAIQPSATGKQCSVQFGDNEWLDVEPAELTVAPEPNEKG